MGWTRPRRGPFNAYRPWRIDRVERDLIRTRTAEGRSRAKARGKYMGRPPSLTPEQMKEASRRRAQGATWQELARSYNVGITTIRRNEGTNI